MERCGTCGTISSGTTTCPRCGQPVGGGPAAAPQPATAPTAPPPRWAAPPPTPVVPTSPTAPAATPVAPGWGPPPSAGGPPPTHYPTAPPVGAPLVPPPPGFAGGGTTPALNDAGSPWSPAPGPTTTSYPAPLVPAPAVPVRSTDPMTWLLAAASGLLFIAYFLPIIEGRSGNDNMAVTLSDESGTWPLVAIAALVAVSAVDVFRLGRTWTTLGAGALTSWTPFFLFYTAIVQMARDMAQNDGGTGGESFSYGSGWFLWLVAFLLTAVLVGVGAVAERRGPALLRSQPWTGVVVGLGGLVWLISLLIPKGEMSVGEHITDQLFGGPFLADVGMFIWLASIGVFSAVAAARRTPGAMAAVAGLAGTWSLWWSAAALDIQTSSIDTGSLFGVAMVVTGTVAALSVLATAVGDGRISTLPAVLGAAPAAGGPGPTVWHRVPLTAVLLVVGIPVAGLAGFA